MMAVSVQRLNDGARSALYDYALKTHVAAWRRVDAALEGAASPLASGQPSTSQ